MAILSKIYCQKRFLTFIFYLLSLNVLNAQTIKGVVADSNGNPISAKLLVKKTSKPDIISEYYIVSNGQFTYKLKKEYDENIIIEVVSIGYSSDVRIIANKDINDPIELNFKLFKETVTILDEVHVVAKKAPFIVKKDTVVFNINSYKDGTERKIEDVLRKLPGIEIDKSSGLIKYNGKSIETVMLEGDDLFGHNYTTGTKNINADMVKEIEAIENYSENALLKGIEHSEKIALNLKLKENKTDISGSIDFGFGGFADQDKTPLDISSNLLGINKAYKSFATFSYNNIGESYSPMVYSNNELNFEAIRELKYYAEKIIPEISVLKIVDQNLSNINHQLFNNYNSIFNFGKKITTKVNLYYLNDKINSDQNSQNHYTINGEEFSTFDNIQTSKKPLYYRGDILLKYKISDLSLLEYSISLRNEEINTDKGIISNQNNNFNSKLYSEDFFFNQRLLYTKKISENKALQISTRHTTNSINQNFTINPSIFNTETADYDSQKIATKKNYIDFKTAFLASRKNDKYNLTLGVFSRTEPLNSQLFSFNNTSYSSVQNSVNDLEYKKYSIYHSGSYHWNLRKLRISPNYTFRFISLNLNGSDYNTSKSNSDLLFEPSLDLFYKLNSISFLNATITFNKKTNSLKYLFTNDILLSNRMILKNLSNLSLQKNEHYSLSYKLNDLFNQTRLNLGISYTKEKGGIFSNYNITSNNTAINYFFLPENTESLNFDFGYSKLISTLATNFRLNSNYSIYNYKNIVNDSELRNNKINHIAHKLFLKTAFNGKINFQNELVYNHIKTYSTENYSIKSIQNNFKIILKPINDFYATFSFDYLVPDLNHSSQNYSFFDSKLSYKPKDKNWEISLSGTNLANEKSYQIIQKTDFSTNISKINLLSRHILLNIYYSFSLVSH